MSRTQTRIAKLVLYNPHAAQRAFHESKARYRVFAAGRQSGKSSACLNELLKRAWEMPNTSYWYLSPTYEQAKLQYRRLCGMLWPCPGVLLKQNQTELRIKLVNQSDITFKSGEVLENLRGATLHGVVIDEVREQPPDLWPMVVRPMLTTTNGWASFTSTPNGFDAFYDLAERAKEDTTGTWDFMSAPSTSNPLFTQDEFLRLKAEMSEAQFAQEILAEFRDLTAGRAYQNFSDVNIKDQNPFAVRGYQLSPYLPIIVGLDFNVNPMSWTLGQQINGDWYWYDEIWIQNTNTQECARELTNRVVSHSAGIVLCGDATGESRNTKATESDYAIILNALREANVKVENRTPNKNPPVKERVNTVNAKLRDANGQAHFWVHPRCKYLIKDLQRVVWKQGANTILDQTTDPLLTHSSDSIGYPLHAMSPIVGGGGVGGLRIITR